MNAIACINCKFHAPALPTRTFGQCRFNPPIFLGADEGTDFPTVASNDWCGKYAPQQNTPTMAKG